MILKEKTKPRVMNSKIINVEGINVIKADEIMLESEKKRPRKNIKGPQGASRVLLRAK